MMLPLSLADAASAARPALRSRARQASPETLLIESLFPVSQSPSESSITTGRSFSFIAPTTPRRTSPLRKSIFPSSSSSFHRPSLSSSLIVIPYRHHPLSSLSFIVIVPYYPCPSSLSSCIIIVPYHRHPCSLMSSCSVSQLIVA